MEWTSAVDAAWHRYEGHGHSTLRLNPAAVALPGSALEVACHEGYPGHHAQFLLMQAAAGPSGIPVESTVVLLRSPVSMLREGAAAYAVELAFPPAERLAFERDVLFPLAGLDPNRAQTYRTVQRLVDELGGRAVPILSDFRDKRMPRALASAALQSDALVTSPEALLGFVERLGPYVLGYTAARERVRGAIEGRAERSGRSRWAVLRNVLEQADVSALDAGAKR